MVTAYKKVNIFNGIESLFARAALDFECLTQKSIAERGRCLVVLCGGETPVSFYQALSLRKNAIPWDDIYFFFGDERYVPFVDPKNNYRLADEYLFSKVGVHENHIYPMPTQYADPREAAKAYAMLLAKFAEPKQVLPIFDITYLGLGQDAHTASLMPGSDIVKLFSAHQPTFKDPIVQALPASNSQIARLTLTPPIINNSRIINFLAFGEAKANAVMHVLKSEYQPLKFPAQLINRHKVIWYLDQEAARLLE